MSSNEVEKANSDEVEILKLFDDYSDKRDIAKVISLFDVNVLWKTPLFTCNGKDNAEKKMNGMFGKADPPVWESKFEKIDNGMYSRKGRKKLGFIKMKVTQTITIKDDKIISIIGTKGWK